MAFSHVALKHAAEQAVAAAPHQHWHYDSKSGLITGFDGRVLDVEGGNRAAGTKVIVYDKTGGLNQQWDYKDGQLFTRMGTGFCIDIEGGKYANGSNLIVYNSHGGNNQKWDIDVAGYIRSRGDSNFCIDVNGGVAGKGLGKVSLWQASANNHQVHIRLKLRESAHQRFHYDAKSGFITAWDGRVLDVDGGSRAAGTKVILYPRKNGGDASNQQWDYKDGQFITRMGTGFCIDINGGVYKPESDLILYGPHGGANQKWDIDQFGYIRSRGNNSFGFDIHGGAKPHNGASRVQLYPVPQL